MPCSRNWNLYFGFWQNVFNILSDIHFVVIQFHFSSLPLHHIHPILLALGLMMETIRKMFWFFEHSDFHCTHPIHTFCIHWQKKQHTWLLQIATKHNIVFSCDFWLENGKTANNMYLTGEPNEWCVQMFHVSIFQLIQTIDNGSVFNEPTTI